MAWSEGLGRERTKLGEWLDRNGITQGELQKWTGLSRPTITSLCGDKDYVPSRLTKRTTIGGLQNKGHAVEEYDFW